MNNEAKTPLQLQKKLLKGLGFGFVEAPMASPSVTSVKPAGNRVNPAPTGRAKRSAPPPSNAPRPSVLPPLNSLPPLGEEEARAELEKLRAGITTCRACDLSVGRHHAVTGEGPVGATIFFLCEAPEEEDDRSGHVLQGKLGEMFWKIVAAMKLDREEVYRTLATRCRGIKGRVPRRSEVEACHPHLRREMEIIRPGMIVCLGEFALESLLPEEATKGMQRVRGKMLEYRGVPLMPTFGLDYMHRNPTKKRDAWRDLQVVMGHLGRK
ncbi:MAG: uracil-DNA glycosylase [Candidatus Sumerlaeia bacterium]|nr:uracil-DNA glycosylase [Candidatus Sumerlaeia bacterium]